MTKIIFSIAFMLVTFNSIGQVIGTVDKRTKEFTVPANQKIDYQYFGYQLAVNTSRKMICFSSHEGDVRSNYSQCPLGSFFDTDKIPNGDKILYLGVVGPFAKMNYVGYDGKKTIFFIPKTCFTMK